MVVRNTSVLGRKGVLQMKGDLFLENTRVLTSLSRDSKDTRLPLAHGRIGSVKSFPSLGVFILSEVSACQFHQKFVRLLKSCAHVCSNLKNVTKFQGMTVAITIYIGNYISHFSH